MDIQNVAQRQDTFGAARQTKGSQVQQGDTQFSGTLGQVDDQAAGDGNKEEKASTTVEADPEVNEQQRLREERLQRFGSYTAYSLWRKTPAMALGIVQPKSEEYFAEHGLLEYWRTEKAHWQGKVAAMSEEERAVTGTSLLDEPVAAEQVMQSEPVADDGASEPVAEPDAESRAVEEVASASVPVAQPATTNAAEPATTSVAQPAVALVAEPAATPVAEVAASPVVTSASTAVEAPAPPGGSNNVPVVETEMAETKSEPVAIQTAEEVAQVAPPVSTAQSVQEPKTQAELRAERLERFGSYTAYSLWRKIPAMALGIVQPKSEEYIAEHGLLEYWYTERDHWQGKVAAMTEEERAATGTSLLETTLADQAESASQSMDASKAGDEAVNGSPPPAPVGPSQPGGEVTTGATQTSDTASMAQELSTSQSASIETAADVSPEQPEPDDELAPAAVAEATAVNEASSNTDPMVNANPVVQEIEQAKTQEELRQERLERFGSYTAYSLWRKIPAMALGIVQPKSEEYFAEHGLLEYWHTEKNHWQSQVASMSLAERAATGTSLLDEV